MKVIGTGSIFSEEVLAALPIGYRFMVQVHTASFGEHYTGQRFSQSARHQARNYRCLAPTKPVSGIIVQHYVADPSDEQ
ncbi:hypothetical protein [Hymenobacter cavernae]|uniref:Uncharacterized protein n=1 Tax=Hymenobacter cavernae TaxID=2044852 RepID=A0ABQ1TWL6_9BACT|nr:hypothetical protein [Hymenobacter cavernae]GGF03788.1 hypothetical protein GCM10011383_13560 [Hymenobacter cavernae]